MPLTMRSKECPLVWETKSVMSPYYGGQRVVEQRVSVSPHSFLPSYGVQIVSPTLFAPSVHVQVVSSGGHCSLHMYLQYFSACVGILQAIKILSCTAQLGLFVCHKRDVV